jgi:hypothetical protein
LSSCRFLGRAEHALFQQEYDRFPRQLRPAPPVGAGSAGRQELPATADLKAAAKRELDFLTRRQRGGFACMTVTVGRDDGMSWAASAVEQVFTEHRADVEIVGFSGRRAAGALPEIADVVTVRRFARAARSAGLTSSFLALSRPAQATWTLLSVLLATAIAMAGTLGKDGGSTLPAWWSLLLALVAAAAGPLAARAKARASVDTGSKAIKDLADDLEAHKDSPGYQDLIEELAAALSKTGRPRCVIVDGFHRLDPVTAGALERYLAKHVQPAVEGRYELWVLFDDRETGTLRKRSIVATLGPTSFAHKWTKSYDLEPLGETERRELADLTGQSDRWNFRTVRAIRHPGRAVFRELFQNYRHIAPAADPGSDQLALLYLLSLTRVWSERPVSVAYLASNLTQSKVVRSEVLRAFLGTEPRLAQVQSTLYELRRSFEKLVEVSWTEGTDEFRLTEPGVGEELARSHVDYHLADPRIGHLFWALFWYDKSQSYPQPYLIRLLADHIRQAASPLGIPGLPEAVYANLYQATLFAAEEALKCCLLDPVPGLLDRARELLQAGGLILGPSDRRRLRRIAWSAYYLLGDERTLMMILALHGDELDPDAGAGPLPAGSPLRRLFLDSLSPPAGRWQRDRTPLLLAGHEAGAAVTAYGEVRAIWLALTLRSFRIDFPSGLRDAIGPGRRELPAILEDAWTRMDKARAALEQSRDAGDGRRPRAGEALTVDFMTLSLGVWCQTLDLVGDQSRLDDDDLDRAARLVVALEDSMLLAAGLAGTPDGRPHEMDIVLDILAKELVAVVGAASLLLSAACAGIPGDRFDQARIADLISWCASELGRPAEASRPMDHAAPELTATIEQHMTLIRAAWASLGFQQVSSCTAIRQAQYHAIVHRRERGTDDARQTAEGIAAELQEPGLIGVLANGVVAERFKWAEELAAGYLLRATLMALDANLGEALRTELCLLTLNRASTYQLDLSPLIRHLLGGEAAVQDSPMARFLAGRADKEVDLWALYLLNAISRWTRDGSAAEPEARVIEVLAERRRDIADTMLGERLQQRIDAHLLRSEILHDQVIDVEKILEDWQQRPRTEIFQHVVYLLSQAVEDPPPPCSRRSGRP